MNDSSSAAFLAFLLGLAVIGGFVYVVAALVQKSNRESLSSEQTFSRIAQQLPQDKGMVFMMQYNNVKKSATAAVLLALFLGGLGAHKFYLGQPGQGILYLLFCWTTIPAWIALVEAFLMPARVSQYNRRKMGEIAMMLGLSGGGTLLGSQ